MLSYLDPIIFPNRCELLEITPQRFVYPIFKNGSSSLYKSGFRVVTDLTGIDQVDVFVREPRERFISGVQTFLEHLDPSLDRKTALYFVNEYLFLNRHFCPQFHWLLNLARQKHVKFRLLPFSHIKEITNKNANKSQRDSQLADVFGPRIDFYLQLDRVLHEDLLGQTVSMGDIVNCVKIKYPEAYQEIIRYSENICDALG